MKGTDLDARIVTVDTERATARVDTRAGAPRRRTADTAGTKVLTNAMVKVGGGASRRTRKRWGERWRWLEWGMRRRAEVRARCGWQRRLAGTMMQARWRQRQVDRSLCFFYRASSGPDRHAAGGVPLLGNPRITPPRWSSTAPPRGTERPAARVQRVAADWRRAAAHPAAGVRRLGRASESRAACGDQATSPDQPMRLCRHNCGGWCRWPRAVDLKPGTWKTLNLLVSGLHRLV